MSRSNQEGLRRVPSDDCIRCGAPVEVDPDRGMFVLRDETPVDEAGPIGSGNRCVDCFEVPRAFVQDEA